MKASVHIPYASRLQDYVAAIWEVKGQRNVSETILPQGVVEIIFNFADSVSGSLPFGNTLTNAPRCFIQGMFTQTMQAEYVGQHHLLGIRLHPHRVRAMIDVLPSELNNITVDLTLIRPEFNRLWHQLAELNSFAEKVLLIESELPDVSDRVCERSKTLSELFLTESTEGFQNVDELAKQICYSPRQLNRVVQDLYGVSAEELTTYKKFVQSVKMIHFEGLSLTDVAYNAGFYDQSHFCRVFKSYTGMTPNQYKKQKGEQPFHIFS
jgi:AraC-like DNA-binding protein